MRRLADRRNFGPKIATFRGRSLQFGTWIFVIIPGSLLTLFCFLYGMLLAGTLYQQHGPALAIIRARSWFIFGTILLVVIGIFFLNRISISFQRIEVFKNGIQFRTRLLSHRSYRWSDLSGIASSATRLTFFGKIIRTSAGGRIYPTFGKPIELTNRFQNIPILIKIVKSNIYPLILPALKSIFRTGGSNQFGRISLSKDYFQISKKKLPWDSVDRIWVDAGYLVVELRGDSNQRVLISEIPNLELLLQVIDWGFQP